jgi:transcriptional regulator with XRE-family HTH domain
MEEFAQSDQTKRFLKSLDDLINKQIVDSDAEFCRKVKYSPQSFSQIRKGRRNITIELLESIAKAYQTDVSFIVTGKEFAKSLDIRPDLRPDLRPANKSQESELERLKVDNESLNNEIKRLNTLIEGYLTAFKALGSGKLSGKGSKRNEEHFSP